LSAGLSDLSAFLSWPYIIAPTSMPASGKMVASETMIALPIAVARCSWKRSIAAITSSRLRVGACATVAVPANATTPTRTFSGCSETNCLAAFCAATRRLGSTSVARMLPEMSIARITVSCCVGSVMVVCGRASASSMAASASRKKAGGMWRRMRWLAPIASRTIARFA
jgi:hypothetical protein